VSYYSQKHRLGTRVISATAAERQIRTLGCHVWSFTSCINGVFMGLAVRHMGQMLPL